MQRNQNCPHERKREITGERTGREEKRHSRAKEREVYDSPRGCAERNRSEFYRA